MENAESSTEDLQRRVFDAVNKNKDTYQLYPAVSYFTIINDGDHDNELIQVNAYMDTFIAVAFMQQQRRRSSENAFTQLLLQTWKNHCTVSLCFECP